MTNKARLKDTTPGQPRSLSVQDIDTFNAAQHRAQRRIFLAIHALDHPGDQLDENGEPFVEAIAELLTDAADDLVIADEVMQRLWKGPAA